jgi:methyl-accepting chemotaxis protein
MEYNVQGIASDMQTFLDVIRQDAEFLQDVPPVQGIVRARMNNGYDEQGKSSYQQWAQRLISIYTNFGTAKPHYMQLRYINESGDEMVRVDFDNGKAIVIPDSELQNKSKRTYFTDTMKTPAGQIYVSAFNLNREHGHVEEPHQPVVRFGIPVFDNAGIRRGIVVLNVHGQKILDFMPRNEEGVLGDFYLVNKDGYYLYHHDNSKTWGFDLDRPDNLFQDLGQLEILSNIRETHGVIRDAGIYDVAYALLQPNPFNKNQRWIIVNTVSHRELFSAVTEFQYALLLLAIITLLLTVGFGMWLSRAWFVFPLANILRVLNKYSRGDMSVRIDNPGNDEIGGVGKAFNEMAKIQQESQQREQHQLAELREAADIREQVEVLLAHIEKVASGDLSETVDIQGSDDLMKLASHLNAMTLSLANVASETRGVAEQLNTTVAEVSATANSQAASATQQAAAISQTTTTLEEIKQTTTQTLEKAQALGSAAERTRQESSQGQAVVQQVITSMGSIRDKVNDIAQAILSLSEQTHQIGEITDVVTDLAQQSKMLALNASIEAAKAGEAGKGFAVVADEVKELAEQSQQSTAQVQKILQDIRHATDRAVMTTEEGTRGVDEGMSLVERTGEVMQALGGVIHDSVMASQQIVAAVRQEVTGVDQVNSAMSEINKVTQSFVASSQQTQSASEDLKQLAEQMQDSINIYKSGE